MTTTEAQITICNYSNQEHLQAITVLIVAS
ncbi:hypothetical protein EZS27_019555 [termite gut metagenome]|uniref:Uncharacterized protein n=1 Tax=termite gut metagenome TaxID=433724 RepID=A0A5J4RFC0_9ZZZZ